MTDSSILPHPPDLRYLAQIIQLAVAPVFLLAGLGAFLNVCAGRLARIVDRIRKLEPRILEARGEEHDRYIDEVRLLDRRSRIVSNAIFATVLAALLIVVAYFRRRYRDRVKVAQWEEEDRAALAAARIVSSSSALSTEQATEEREVLYVLPPEPRLRDSGVPTIEHEGRSHTLH